jgi:DNA primase
MMDRAETPSISSILSRLDVPPGRHGRTICPIHHGQNRFAFSYDDDRGVWYCFRCGIGGDAVDLIKQVTGTDFKGALRWLGIEPGKPPAPDPERIRQRRIREGLLKWAKTLGRQMRNEFYTRELVITEARRRLERDPDDEWAWTWLAWALTGKDALENKLDMIDIGTEEQRLAMYREMRRRQ